MAFVHELACQLHAVFLRQRHRAAARKRPADRVRRGIILADQPRITADHLLALRDKWSGDEQEIVATAYDGIEGAPALLPSGTFDRLSELDGDRGARAIFDDPDFTVRSIPFADAAVDVDTQDDLRRLGSEGQAAE